ncbi:MAG: MaoC/PaaZ C-terminal domain-containing protein [Candidatus Heimdallarchaeota archaeon]
MKKFPQILDSAIIGRSYSGSIETIDPIRTLEFAKATNETNPGYFDTDESRRLVPPLFPVTTMFSVSNKLVQDPTLNLDFSRMVHGEHSITYTRPLKPGNQIRTSTQLESIDVKSSGEVLWIRIEGHHHSDLVFVMRAGLFFKNQEKGRSRSKTQKIPSPSQIQDFLFQEKMVVESDQAIRYSKASGDMNPIHLDPDFARMVGLPDVILQGLCTMAFAAQAILNGTDTSPTKLKCIKTRFARPVFMGDALTTHAWLIKKTNESQILGFRTDNQDGYSVLTHGEAELLNE